MATKAKPAKKTSIPMKTIKPLPPMPGKKGECGVDGYCCQGKSEEDCCGGSCGGSCKSCGCHLVDLLLVPATWGRALFAAAVFLGFDFFWHGHLLMPRYAETAGLWRPMADMQALWPWCVGYHALLGVIFAVAFSLMGATTWLKGLKNGLLILSPIAANTIMAWVSQPLPSDITQMWALGVLAQGALAGAVLGFCAGRRHRQGDECCGGSGGGCC